MVREQISKDYQNFSREQVKRDLLDKLSDAHDFELPNRMVDLDLIEWHQFESELENQARKLTSWTKWENGGQISEVPSAEFVQGLSLQKWVLITRLKLRKK